MKHAATPTDRHRPRGPTTRSVRLSGLLLLDAQGHDPLPLESVAVTDEGIAVVRSRGEAPRVLPWSSVVAHAVEPWAGGPVPGVPAGGGGTAGADDHRSVPVVEAGALLSVQTPTGTFRFLRAGTDPVELSRRIAALAVHHQGPRGASTVTTVVGPRRRPVAQTGPTWSRVRPYLVVLLVVVVSAAVTVILLQSAGVLHLPWLGTGAGGSGSTALSRR